MFKVECPECSAPYQVDERRVPSAGVKMRCPKCRASFVVHKPGDEAGLPDARNGGSARAATQDSTTMLGVAAPVQGKPPPRKAQPRTGSGAGPEPRSAIRPPGAPPPRPQRAAAKLNLRPKLGSQPDKGAVPDSEPGLPASVAGRDLPGIAADSDRRPSLPGLALDDTPGLPDTPASDRPSLPSKPDSSRPSLPIKTDPNRPSLPSALQSRSQLPQSEPDEASKATGFSDFDLSFDADVEPEGGSSLPPALGGRARSAQPKKPSVPHPATSKRSSVPRPESFAAASSDSGELPPPQEPEVIDSVIPLTESDISSLKPAGAPTGETTTEFSLDGSLELPSPAADFEEELARGMEPEEPGDFGIPASIEAGGNDSGQRSPTADIESLAATRVVIEEAPSFDPDSLPDLPDLDGMPSNRPQTAATVVDGPSSADFGDDMFTLDSSPPSKAAPGASQASPGAAPGGGLQDDDPFADALTNNSMADFEVPGEFGSGQFGELDSSPPAASADPTEYGEVSLPTDDDSGAGLEMGDSFEMGDDDAEFGAIPQEEPGPNALEERDSALPPRASQAEPSPPIASPTGTQAEPAGATKPRTGKAKWVFAAALLLAMGGGALALLPDVGPFGIYLISDLLNREAHEALLRDTAKEVEALAAKDSFASVPEVVAVCERARSSAPRFDALVAYKAFAQYSAVARFGGQPELQANAKVLLDTLSASGVEADLPHLVAAQAAQAVVLGDVAGAKRSLASAQPKGTSLLALEGELLVSTGQFAQAAEVWSKAVAASASAWTHGGLARALLGASQLEAAEDNAKKALGDNPEHIGARLVLANVRLKNGDEEGAVGLIDEVLERRNLASRQEAVEAHTLMGEIHLHRGRLSKAEAAFTLALETNPKDVRASVGLADTHYDAGRYATALARYEIAGRGDDPPLAASLGIAKCQLALDRLQKAKEVLAQLQEKYGKEPAVAYWTGKWAAASGGREKAEASYRLAMADGADEDIAVNAAVALGQLLSQGGKPDEAQKVLAEAQKRFPKSVLLRNSMGEVALAQGRYEQALAEFRAAKALDAADVTAVFNEGSALRRLKRFEEAWGVFEQVAKLDKDLPGLPLERGLLLEQSGRSEEALEEYELALSKDPDDPDLKLRVGCGRVAVGEGKAAEEMLAEVVKHRSRVAEAHHCLGRALFLQGRNVEALKRLQEATTLDSNRAEYHMYVGWVANEAGQVELAKRELNTALSLDQGLADAYWQRGVLSLRQGGAGDAIIDIKKALAIRPSRYEAHADLAQASYQMGRMQDALNHWQQALAHDDENPTWQFRFGKLLHNQHRNAEAATHLEKAIALAEKEESPPAWLWEAHHLAASSLGAGARALEHWKKFLELGPQDSPYRTDAKRALRQAGQPWHGR